MVLGHLKQTMHQIRTNACSNNRPLNQMPKIYVTTATIIPTTALNKQQHQYIVNITTTMKATTTKIQQHNKTITTTTTKQHL